MIDLRSDTVTRPTPKMLSAMMAAETGDDVYGEDPTVNELESYAAELTGHQARVLHMAQSPDGTTVVSAAADETLRFWKCFDNASEKTKKVRDSNDSSVLRRFNFR